MRGSARIYYILHSSDVCVLYIAPYHDLVCVATFFLCCDFSKERKKSKVDRKEMTLKLCLHVTSACASTCDANIGIQDTKWWCLHVMFAFMCDTEVWNPFSTCAFVSPWT